MPLLPEPEARPDEVPVDADEEGDHCSEERYRDPQRYIGNTEKTVAETVDQIENRIHVGDILCGLRKRVDAVEDAAEIHERSEHEGRDDVDAVDRFGIDAVDETCEREDQGGKQSEGENDQYVMDSEVQAGEEERDEQYDRAHEHAADDAATDEPCDEQPWWGRGHEDLIDRSREEFGREKHERRVGIRCCDDREHDESGDDKRHVVDALHVTDTRTEDRAEDREVEHRRDDARQERLHPDAEHPHHVFADHGVIGYPFFVSAHSIIFRKLT